jgi:hypothetical protein
MFSRSSRAILVVLVLGLTVVTALPQGTSVQVFRSRAGFEEATGARPLPFPASATVLPLKDLFPGLSDYSCVDSPPGIELPVGSTAPLATITWAQTPPPGLLCFLGKEWNAGPANIEPQPESPTIVANGEDDFLVTFASPVYAVGMELLTNSYAAETITLRFADGTEEFPALGPLVPNTRQFVGFVSAKPVVSVNVDTTGGGVQNEGIEGIQSAFAVEIDIKPCSDPSPVNLKSNGVVTAAILGSDSLDVSLIDPGTVTLQGLSPKEPGNSGKLLCKIEDLVGRPGSCGPDGLPDLVCHFQMAESERDLTEETWTLRATTYSGVALYGFDSVRVIIPPSTGNGSTDGDGHGSADGNGTGNGAGNGNGNAGGGGTGNAIADKPAAGSGGGNSNGNASGKPDNPGNSGNGNGNGTGNGNSNKHGSKKP